MNFDINEVIANMLSAIKASVKDDWSIVKDTANDFLQSKKDRLELLSSLRLTNQIDEAFFELRLEDEKKILESELHAIAILTAVAAQNAANAALDVLSKAINSALGNIIH